MFEYNWYSKDDRIRTPASIHPSGPRAVTAAPFKRAARQNSGANHITSAQGRLGQITFSSISSSIFFLSKAKHAFIQALSAPFSLSLSLSSLSLSPLSLSLSGRAPAQVELQWRGYFNNRNTEEFDGGNHILCLHIVHLKSFNARLAVDYPLQEILYLYGFVISVST